MAVKKIEHRAPKKGPGFLTLDELEGFIREAREAGATGTEAIHGGVTWGGRVSRVSVELDLVAVDVLRLGEGEK